MDDKKKTVQTLTDEDLVQASGGSSFMMEMAEENPLPQPSYKYEVGQIVYVYGGGSVNNYLKAKIVGRGQSRINFGPEYSVLFLEGNGSYQIVSENKIALAD